MNFIDAIIQNSQVREARLYQPSKKAMENPETGVVIQNPSAFHVIKDCATLANKYLPHYIFGLYANPFEVLKGKVLYNDVVEFVKAAMSDVVMNQLLILMLEKIKKSPVQIYTSSNDPYGDYESFNTSNKEKDTVITICEAFSVTLPSK